MPEFFFQRYVNGERMADDVLITKQATLEDAIPAALRLCWNSPKSVLVHIPQSPWRDIESAPKDGTKFLLLYLGELIIASWAHVISSETRELVGHNVKWFDGKETVQPLKDGLGRIPDCLFWMPLPEPPR